MSPAKSKLQVKRQVLLYKKANWNKLKRHFEKLGKRLNMENNNENVHFWVNFMKKVEIGIEKYIPHRVANLMMNFHGEHLD